MAIGATDYIDQLLVDKYAMEKVDNHKSLRSMIKPEQVLEAMTGFSNMSRNMLILNQQLSSSCSAIKAANAKYRKAAVPTDAAKEEDSENNEYLLSVA